MEAKLIPSPILFARSFKKISLSWPNCPEVTADSNCCCVSEATPCRWPKVSYKDPSLVFNCSSKTTSFASLASNLDSSSVAIASSLDLSAFAFASNVAWRLLSLANFCSLSVASSDSANLPC